MSSIKKTAVVGYGSIGARHEAVLAQLGHEVSICSQRKLEGVTKLYHDLESVLSQEQLDYIVLANKTGDHYGSLNQLKELGFKGKVLVEKPLFEKAHSFDWDQSKNVFVGYNLRFHPALQALKKILENEKVLSVQVYCGKYLPSWRQNPQYYKSYSAHKDQGGGVLRDLSHELDYLLWLFGSWKRVCGFADHLSSLEINSEDVAAGLMETADCPLIQFQMNYLDRLGRRKMVVNTEEHTYYVDLIKNTLKSEDGVEFFDVQRNDTYRLQHDSILNGEQLACSFEQGVEIMKLIDAFELSIESQQWQTAELGASS